MVFVEVWWFGWFALRCVVFVVCFTSLCGFSFCLGAARCLRPRSNPTGPRPPTPRPPRASCGECPGLLIRCQKTFFFRRQGVFSMFFKVFFLSGPSSSSSSYLSSTSSPAFVLAVVNSSLFLCEFVLLVLRAPLFSRESVKAPGTSCRRMVSKEP